MKTAISIPDEVFESADRAAKALGVSRSELYARAVREFLERSRCEGVTERLNEIYGKDATDSGLDEGLAALQAASMEKEDW